MECRFNSESEKKALVKDFLKKYGDNLPPEALNKAETLINNFVLECDTNNDITSAVTYEPKTDWYLCTIRYLATHADHRKKGLGLKVATEVIENAKKNPNCLVLAADIDFDNMFSKKVFERLGFTERTRFCWGAGQKPADILHYVKFPPQADGKSC